MYLDLAKAVISNPLYLFWTLPGMDCSRWLWANVQTFISRASGIVREYLRTASGQQQTHFLPKVQPFASETILSLLQMTKSTPAPSSLAVLDKC